ncbi:hypothetical protein HAX54_030753 [Datura stramonium]|uniref:Uncharacterized protein n=1 Tax=Datura stramonium TaxID=4076 RepID=A0ABS8VBK7_DATST|nr:hypothetical protein [Datura stramonium]
MAPQIVNPELSILRLMERTEIRTTSGFSDMNICPNDQANSYGHESKYDVARSKYGGGHLRYSKTTEELCGRHVDFMAIWSFMAYNSERGRKKCGHVRRNLGQEYTEQPPLQFEDANYINNAQGSYQRNKQACQNLNNLQNDNNFENGSSNPYIPLRGQQSNAQHWREGPTQD